MDVQLHGVILRCGREDGWGYVPEDVVADQPPTVEREPRKNKQGSIPRCEQYRARLRIAGVGTCEERIVN